MPEKKKTQATWTDVKSVLYKMRREELITTIDALYKLRKENKQFLHTRFKLGENTLDEYKQKISKGVNPSITGKVSFKNAKQALSDYKNAIGDMEGLAELMVFYCEECAKFIRKCGVWEQYADATINIWHATLKHLSKLSNVKQIHYREKLDSALKHMGDAGWGVTDCINDYMYEYAPQIEDTEEKAQKEDMW
jgi:hypothetical protein